VCVVARVLREPCLYCGMLMRSIVVHDDMDVKLGWHNSIDMLQELEELAVPMPGQTALDDFAAQSVERGKDRSCSVAPIVMGLTRWNSWP
jgi:hypothetical protein